MKNESRALALGNLPQCLDNDFSLLHVRERCALYLIRSKALYIEPFQALAFEVFAREVHDRCPQIVGEGTRLTDVGETPECTKEGLLCNVLRKLSVADEQIS